MTETDHNSENPQKWAGNRRGAPRKNTDQRDWRPYLDILFDRVPTARMTRVELHRSALHTGGKAVPSSKEEFLRKLAGNRAASEAFARALYEALPLKSLGVGFGSWTAPLAQFTSALDGVDRGSLSAFLQNAMSGSDCQLRMTADRPRPVARRIAPIPRGSVFAAGSIVSASLSIQPPADIDQLHLLLIDLGRDDGKWQCLNAVAETGLADNLPLELDTPGQRVSFKTQPVSLAVPGTFTTFAVVQGKPFHHGIKGIIDATSGEQGLLSVKDVVDLEAMLAKPPDWRAIASFDYTVAIYR